MLKVKPELWAEWNFKKNDKLGFDIYNITKASAKKVWWTCLRCKESFDSSVINRAKSKTCPYCSGRRVGRFNSLAYLFPEISSEWHPTKNGDLTPHDVTSRVATKVWWLGECGHEWETRIQHRTDAKSGCPYCSISPRVLKGFNDMWTTNPELASLLVDPEDGYKYTQQSNKKTNWKCPHCDTIMKNKHISSVCLNGLRCRACSDGFSSGEKFMYNFLIHANIDFEIQKTFPWSNKKRYDFFVPSLSLIIETHGDQHRRKSFETLGGKTLEEEQANDEYKHKIAISNGIKNYIVVDTPDRNFYKVQENVISSGLLDVLGLTSDIFDGFTFKYNNSFMITAWEMSDNSMSISDIANELKMHEGTIRRYLEVGAYLGKCKYKTKKQKTIKKDGN